MYVCDACKERFREAGSASVWMEDYYGVASEFNTRTHRDLECCPHCGSFEFEEIGEPEVVRDDAKLLNGSLRVKKKADRIDVAEYYERRA